MEGTQDEFKKADVEMLRLANGMGDRINEMGIMMVFDMISLIGEDLLRLSPLEYYVLDHSSDWEAGFM
jgi:hypothetical protein